MSYLSGEGMRGGYGGADILDGCSIEVDRGEIAVIVGPNGAGKSTAMKALIGMLPLREGDAEAMIAQTRGAALLGSLRGQPAADVASLAACLYALADFACANADHLAEIDLNPIKALPQGQGCIVVDALIVARPRE